MHKRLKWNAIGLENKTNTLIDLFEKKLSEIPTDHSRIRKPIFQYINELKHLLHSIELINSTVIPFLEKTLRIDFKTPEMLYLALCRHSVNHTFKQVADHCELEGISPFTQEEFKELYNIGDVGDTLALIGDAALDLAIVESYWDSSLSKIGELSKKRANIAKNEHLASICDKWNIYEYRIKQLADGGIDPSNTKKLQHEKGTLIEAIYGVIYLEFGFETVLECVPMIQ